MALSIGARLGPYEILSAIGAGGMGEVYRARDTKLNRDVAIKVLSDLFANDPERLARFQREAQALASLNHPHIAAIYGLEDADGIRALVLELVDGRTLADRIAEGPMPLDEVLPIARQIAEALEAAHEQGIIHRDLKPANVKVTPEGKVNSSRKEHLDLYQKAASGVGSEDLLLADSQAKAPTSWSPDDRFILYSSGADMWVLPLTGDRKPFPFAQTPFNEAQGRFSPDGHWIAYVSNEAGRNDVYVAPFQGPGGKSLVSTAGGIRPRWRRDGKELFYVAPNNKLMAVTLTATGNRLEIGAPQPLFDLQPRNVTQDYYDVSPDGQRFLVNTTDDASAPITVVVNWTAALKR